MSDHDFDPSLYSSAPVLTIGSAVALVDALCETHLESEPAIVARARKKLHRVGEAAKAAMKARQKALGAEGSPGDPALDAEADNTWSALRMRLVAWTLLPAKKYPQAARAAKVLLKLFGGEGLSYLKLPYPDQWAAMGARLEVADEDGIVDEINELAGEEFLEQAHAVQKRYGAMVRAMLLRDEVTGERLIDHVRAVQKAVVDYATKVAATVEEDEDPGSAERARVALRAIEKRREDAARKPTQSEAGDDGDAGRGETEDPKKGDAKPASEEGDAAKGSKKG